jgi:hypothetical protein
MDRRPLKLFFIACWIPRVFRGVRNVGNETTSFSSCGFSLLGKSRQRVHVGHGHSTRQREHHAMNTQLASESVGPTQEHIINYGEGKGYFGVFNLIRG